MVAVVLTAMLATGIDEVMKPFFVDAELTAKGPDPRGGNRGVTVPPCTPLQLPMLDDGKSKRAYVSYGPWRDLFVRRKDMEAATRYDDFKECVSKADAYAGRYREEHIDMLFHRTLAVDMPMEFALIVLGPDGNQAVDSGVVDLTWTFRSGMLQACEPLEPHTVDHIALHELAVGRVRIRTSEDGRSIESIRVTVPPEVAAPACLAYDAGLRAQNFGEEAEALEIWQALAETGYPPAQHAVAELLRRGETVEHRPAEAREWYRKAAEAGYAPAMVRLAYLVARADDEKRDMQAAWRWMTAAATLGSEEAEDGLHRLAIGLSPERVAELERSADGWFTAPEPLEHPLPEKPEIPSKLFFVGNVILEARILADGSVSNVRIRDVQGPRLCFEEAAVEAVRRWRYRPATRGGIAVPTFATIEVVFR